MFEPHLSVIMLLLHELLQAWRYLACNHRFVSSHTSIFSTSSWLWVQLFMSCIGQRCFLIFHKVAARLINLLHISRLSHVYLLSSRNIGFHLPIVLHLFEHQQGVPSVCYILLQLIELTFILHIQQYLCISIIFHPHILFIVLPHLVLFVPPSNKSCPHLGMLLVRDYAAQHCIPQQYASLVLYIFPSVSSIVMVQIMLSCALIVLANRIVLIQRTHSIFHNVLKIYCWPWLYL